jgi:hypothetical protein
LKILRSHEDKPVTVRRSSSSRNIRISRISRIFWKIRNIWNIRKSRVFLKICDQFRKSQPQNAKVSFEGTAETTAQGLVVEGGVRICACPQEEGSIVRERELNAGGGGGVAGGSEWRLRCPRCMDVVVFLVHLTG